MDENSEAHMKIDKCTISIPDDFYTLMAQRKHIEFERADLQNNIKMLEYFYTNHRAFCEYHMKLTKGIYNWTNYHTFLSRQ